MLNVDRGFTGDSIPLAAGSLYGLRAFDVNPKRGTLHGVSFPQEWSAGENDAVCEHGELRKKEHSMAECEHGFWSYYGNHANYLAPHRAAGVIEGYGEVVIGEKGFRAEKARIRALVLPDPKELVDEARINMNVLYRFRRSDLFLFLEHAGFLALSLVLTIVFMGGTYLAISSRSGIIAAIAVLFTLLNATMSWDRIQDVRRSYIQRKKLSKKLSSFLDDDLNMIVYKEKGNKATQEEVIAVANQAVDRVRERYSDALIYDSVDEMVAEYADKISDQKKSIGV